MLQPSPQTTASRAYPWAAPLMIDGFVPDDTALELMPPVEEDGPASADTEDEATGKSGFMGLLAHFLP
ncbi:MAG: hypothetical protein VKJ09_01860 [Leptolyngbya sp.]|nr:hypothetical protein [Leptolyngbya sp.]